MRLPRSGISSAASANGSPVLAHLCLQVTRRTVVLINSAEHTGVFALERETFAVRKDVSLLVAVDKLRFVQY
jgi:hypothetical protein